MSEDEKVERWWVWVSPRGALTLENRGRDGWRRIEVVPASALARVEAELADLRTRYLTHRDSLADRLRETRARAEKAEAERDRFDDEAERLGIVKEELKVALREAEAERDDAEAGRERVKALYDRLHEEFVKEGNRRAEALSRLEAVREWAEEVHRTLPSRSQIYAGATRVLSLLDKKETP